MAAAPTVKIEVEFSPGTWTDVTSYCQGKRPFSATGGRSDTDQRVAPGRLSSLVLDNTDGRFTVGNSAGTYAPNVASGRRVRYSIQNPVTLAWVVRWTGTVDGWPLSWEDNGSTCLATVAGTDALLALTAPIPPGRWMEYVYRTQAAAVWYWPMTDDATDRSHREISGGPPMVAGLTAPRPSQPGPASDIRPLPANGDGTDSASWSAWVESGSVYDWSTSMLFKASSPPTAAHVPLYVATPAGAWAGAYLTTSGYLRVGANWGGPYGSASVNICDGRWWLLTIGGTTEDDNWVSATAICVEDPTVYTSASVSEITEAQALCDAVTRALNVRVAAAATIGHVAWRADLNNVDLVPSLSGFPSENDVGAWGDLWNAAFDPDVTVYTIGGAHWLAARPIPSSMLEAWAPVDAVDRGITYAERDGTIWHRDGEQRTRGTVLALTLTAAEIDPSWQVAVDRIGLCNTATVTAKSPVSGRTYGQVTVTDPTSVARYGEIESTIEVAGVYYGSSWLGDERAVEPIASALLVLAEAPRIPSFTIDALALTAAQQAALLSVGMWSLVAVTGLPTAGGMPSAWLGRVEGWTETVGVDQWTVTFNVSYAGGLVGDATFAVIGTMRLG